MTFEARPPAHLTVRGDLLCRDYLIRDGQLIVAEELTIPPGYHPLHLSCDAQRIISMNDLRVNKGVRTLYPSCFCLQGSR